MTDRTRWKQVEHVVRKVIHAWDPYSLIEGGAPEGEWNSEILQIVGRLDLVTSPAAAAATVSTIFTSAFQPEGFSPEDCADVGQKLFDALKEANLTRVTES